MINKNNNKCLGLRPHSVQASGLAVAVALVSSPLWAGDTIEFEDGTTIDWSVTTSYGIGMGLARITRAVLRNEQVSLPVSTLLRGEYGEDGIFIGVPAVIGRTGVHRVVELELDTTEREQLARSASALRAVSEQFEILR